MNCLNWAIKGSALRTEGFAPCAAEPNDLLRKARTTSAESVCRLERFTAATERVVASRRKALGIDGEQCS